MHVSCPDDWAVPVFFYDDIVNLLLILAYFYSNEAMRVYPALLASLQRRVELGSGGKMIVS